MPGVENYAFANVFVPAETSGCPHEVEDPTIATAMPFTKTLWLPVKTVEGCGLLCPGQVAVSPTSMHFPPVIAGFEGPVFTSGLNTAPPAPVAPCVQINATP